MVELIFDDSMIINLQKQIDEFEKYINGLKTRIEKLEGEMRYFSRNVLIG